MEVPLVIHNRVDHVKLQSKIQIEENDTIEEVEERISTSINIPKQQISILLCGKVLERKTTVKELLLGPTTCLVVIVISKNREDSDDTTNSLVRNSPQIGSFYVFCKSCDDIQRGKLRVYCSSCDSTALVVLTDPSEWDDVLKSKRIPCHCEECDVQTWASFKFKCIKCSEISAPLSQIRGNWENSECCICFNEKELYVFDFGCNHASCRPCFEQYALSCLQESQFRFHHPYGYTITCPSPDCNNCLKDVHHLWVLGSESYQRYQVLATEKLIALDEQGFFCPYPECSTSFFWESNDEQFISCPSCYRLFCRYCKSKECLCQSDEASKETIAATTKKCPGCSADTEKNGGCAHMHCTSCGLHWCFRCVKAWADECQWDHWFG